MKDPIIQGSTIRFLFSDSHTSQDLKDRMQSSSSFCHSGNYLLTYPIEIENNRDYPPLPLEVIMDCKLLYDNRFKLLL